eukprot:m.66693 g.66693  ORF g.66693 m.66693 type:complete len:423 (+) comp13772_c0_seq1:652-1920(+)
MMNSQMAGASGIDVPAPIQASWAPQQQQQPPAQQQFQTTAGHQGGQAHFNNARSKTGKGGKDDDDGVWSQDIEEAFEEALNIYPPCGRRKIIISEEGKMYGRNELIARYIKMKTGKTRSRKQVSSHIQVLARKKQREMQSRLKQDPQAAAHVSAQFQGLSSAEIVSRMMSTGGATAAPEHAERQPGSFLDHKGHASHGSATYPSIRLAMEHFSSYIEFPSGHMHQFVHLTGSSTFADPHMESVDIPEIEDKFPGLKELYAQCPDKNRFFLLKFWADFNFNPAECQTQPGPFFGVSTSFESLDNVPIECSTQAISLGRPFAEKIQAEYPTAEGGRYVYRFFGEPLCSCMISVLEKLRMLDNLEKMNRVLEGFSILQIVRNNQTKEVLFCCAYMFEIAQPGQWTKFNCYKLTNGPDGTGRRYTA